MPSSASRVLVLALIASAVVPLSARAAGPIEDEETGVKFHPEQTVAGKTFQCLGAGARSVFVVKVYAAEFCLEQGSLQPALDYAAGAKAQGGRQSEVAGRLAEDPGFFKTLVDTSGSKLMIMHFVRDVSQQELAKAFRKSLSKVLPPEKVEKLTALIQGNPRKNEDVKIWSTGNVLTIDVAGNVNKVDDAQIEQNIWSVWFGPDSVSPSLKKSIAKNVVKGLGANAGASTPSK